MVELVKLCKLPFSHSGPLSLATLNPAQTHGFILSLVNLSFFLHTSFYHSFLTFPAPKGHDQRASLPSHSLFSHLGQHIIHQSKGLDEPYTMGWMKFS